MWMTSRPRLGRGLRGMQYFTGSTPYPVLYIHPWFNWLMKVAHSLSFLLGYCCTPSPEGNCQAVYETFFLRRNTSISNKLGHFMNWTIKPTLHSQWPGVLLSPIGKIHCVGTTKTLKRHIILRGGIREEVVWRPWRDFCPFFECCSSVQPLQIAVCFQEVLMNIWNPELAVESFTSSKCLWRFKPGNEISLIPQLGLAAGLLSARPVPPDTNLHWSLDSHSSPAAPLTWHAQPLHSKSTSQLLLFFTAPFVDWPPLGRRPMPQTVWVIYVSSI